MKKNQNKGFMLAETLIAATFILGTLVFLYIQFRNVNQGYQTLFTYNTVDALYAAENMKKFYLQDNFDEIAASFRSNMNRYLDLSECPASYIGESEYCQKLMDILGIKTVIFADVDTNYLVDVLDTTDISPSLQKFIRYVKNDEEGVLLKYRIFIEMDDGTFATAKLGEAKPQPYFVHNLFQDGDFEQSGWSPIYIEEAGYSTDYALHGNYSMKVNGVASKVEVVFYTTHTISLVPTHLYYARIGVYKTNPANTAIDMYWPEAEPSVLNGVVNKTNEWQMISMLSNRSTFNAVSSALRLDYNNEYQATPIYFDGALLIDLTADFGAGKEPSKEWCDENIPFFNGEYQVER